MTADAEVAGTSGVGHNLSPAQSFVERMREAAQRVCEGERATDAGMLEVMEEAYGLFCYIKEEPAKETARLAELNGTLSEKQIPTLPEPLHSRGCSSWAFTPTSAKRAGSVGVPKRCNSHGARKSLQAGCAPSLPTMAGLLGVLGA